MAAMIIKKMTTKKLTGRTRVSIVIDIPHDRGRHGDTPEEEHGYIQERVERNKWLLEHFTVFQPWDHSYNMHLLGDSFLETGRNIRDYDRHVGSDKQAKTCMYAGALLHKVASGDTLPENIDTLKKRWDRNTMYSEKVRGNLHQIKHRYNFDNAMGMDREEYENKMTRIALKTHSDVEERVYQDMMALITKYFRSWWN